MRILFATLFLAFGGASAAWGQPRTHNVENDGEYVEITVIDTPAPAGDFGFFDEKPLEVFSSTLTVHQLTLRYADAFRKNHQAHILKELARRSPKSERDIRALLDLYVRYTRSVRRPVQLCLGNLTPEDRHFEPFFNMLIEEKNSAFQAFGMLGALQIRSESALPGIRELAKHKLDRPGYPEPVAVSLQALRVLSVWRAPGTIAIIKRQSRTVPELAALLAEHFWEQSLPQIVRWSESKKKLNQDRALAAWKAPVPKESLKKTLPDLRALVLNPKKKPLTRHQAALKLGGASDDAEVRSLLSQRAETSDPDTRLYLTAALFASRNPQVVPLLMEHAKTNPSADQRLGAVTQLKDMLQPEDYRQLLEWMADNDADEGNRAVAKKELSFLQKP